MTEAEWLTSNDPSWMLARVLGQPEGSGGSSGGFVGRRLASDRKLRLFACACVRSAYPDLREAYPRVANAVTVAEAFADGLATSKDRGKAMNTADLIQGAERELAYGCLRSDSAAGALEVSRRHTLLPRYGDQHEARQVQAALIREIVGDPLVPVLRLSDQYQGDDFRRRHAGTLSEHLVIREGWLTPTVIALAQAAYDERPGRECEECHGKGGWKRCNNCGGEWAGKVGPDCFVCGHPYLTDKQCPRCDGTGRISDGDLDPARLLILADSLEEAGCTEEALLRHLRSPGPHVRGCWALDLILGKE